MAVLASLITDTARRLMGDDDAAVYTDSMLIPGAGKGPVNNAYRFVQSRLANSGCSVLQDTSAVLTVPAGTLAITAASSPALPTNFMVPYKLWERAVGGTDADWVPVRRGDELPVRTAYDILGDWVFEGIGIDLIGATTTREIKMQYEKLLPTLDNLTDPVGILGGEDAIAFYTCSLMSMSRGQPTMAEYFEKKAVDAVDELVNRFVHSNQAVHGRRRLAYGRSATLRY